MQHVDRTKPALLGYVFGTSFIGKIHWGLLLPLLLVSLGVSADKIGLMYMIANLVAIPILICLFTVSDYKGMYVAMAVILLSVGIANFLFSTQILTLVLIGMCLANIEGWGSSVLQNVYAIKCFTAKMCETTGHFSIAWAVASVIASFAGGFLIAHYGFSVTAIVSGVIAMGMLSLVLFIKNIKHAEGTKQTEHKAKWFFVPTKKHMSIIICRVLVLFATGILFAFALPLYLKDVYALSVQNIGISLGVFATASIAGSLLSKVADKYCYKKIVYLCLTLGGIFYMSVAFANSLILVLLFIWLATFFMSICAIAIVRFYDSAVTQHGKELSTLAIGDMAGNAIAVISSGILIVNYGYNILFVIAGVAVLCSVLMLISVFGMKSEKI